MTKRERAIREIVWRLTTMGDRGQVPDVIGEAFDAAMAIMAEPDQPPEGKQREPEQPLLFVSFMSARGGFHFRVVTFGGTLATGADFEELISILEKDVGSDVVLISWRRAEEKVQGREVGAGDGFTSGKSETIDMKERKP